VLINLFMPGACVFVAPSYAEIIGQTGTFTVDVGGNGFNDLTDSQ